MAEHFTVADELAKMRAGWDALAAYVAALTPEQREQHTDAAGWTVKDHLMHLAQWHVSFPAILDGTSRAASMGISQEQWEEASRNRAANGWDVINNAMQQQYHDLPFDDVMRVLRERFEMIYARVAAMTDDALNLPYSHYQPSSSEERPVGHWVEINTYEHYDEHMDWMRRIAEG